MRNNSTDLLASQLTTAFLKSGLTTAEFVQHIINTREPIQAKVDEKYASVVVAMPCEELGGLAYDMHDGRPHRVVTFYKHHDSNNWGCKE